METITITTEYIKLQDLLKFAAEVGPGDVVAFNGQMLTVAYES